jgi:hypothetical protein
VRLAYFSPVPWASFRQRPHEFADWFQRRLGGPVLWIDPYPVRLPRAGDLRRPRVAATGAGAPPEGLRQLRPTALPFEPYPWGRRLNARLFWPPVLRELQDFCAQDKVLLAIGKPSDLALQALQQLPKVASLYDAMDDFSAFHEGRAQQTAARIEGEIVRRVRWRCTSSSHIAERLAVQRLQVEHLPNGVASERLPAASMGTPDGPFGYVGTVAAWFDWAWVRELALAWPERRIEIHGPVYQAPAIALPANVSLHPPMPHEQALQRMRSFAAGLIPFLRNGLTDSVDPVKYYEYRALGLPVLATPFGEMRGRAGEPRVLLTDNPQAAREATQRLLAARDTAESVAEFRRLNDWSARFEPLAVLLRAIP